jgi:uncharacterized membrane protein YdbT with pleckstrin-like domain
MPSMSRPTRYVRRVLQPNEGVVYATRLHWRIYLRCAALLLVGAACAVAAPSFAGRQPEIGLALRIVAVMFVLLALSAGLSALVRRATTELVVTNHRVIFKTGLMSRHTLEMNRDKVESVDVDQTILGRILGYGTVVVRGTGGGLEPIGDIADPLVFRSYITAAR